MPEGLAAFCSTHEVREAPHASRVGASQASGEIKMDAKSSTMLGAHCKEEAGIGDGSGGKWRKAHLGSRAASLLASLHNTVHNVGVAAQTLHAAVVLATARK